MGVRSMGRPGVGPDGSMVGAAREPSRRQPGCVRGARGDAGRSATQVRARVRGRDHGRRVRPGSRNASLRSPWSGSVSAGSTDCVWRTSHWRARYGSVGGIPGRAARARESIDAGPCAVCRPGRPGSAHGRCHPARRGVVHVASVRRQRVSNLVGRGGTWPSSHAPRHCHRACTTAFETLCATPFVVSTRSDRMGCRLEGTASWGDIPGSLPSAPTAPGAVQLPPGGEPILLMADHPTTGGYAQIAVLCRADRQIADSSLRAIGFSSFRSPATRRVQRTWAASAH